MAEETLRTDEILRALRAELAKAKPEPVGSSPEPDPALRQLEHQLEERWRLTPKPFKSKFPFVARFRTLWNEISTRWYVQPLAEQQTEFNHAVLQLLNVLGIESRHRWTEAAPQDRANVALARTLAQLEVVLRRIEGELVQPRGKHDLAEIRARLARLENGAQALLPVPAAFGTPINYVGFEDRFRGSSDEVKERQRPYLPYFTEGPVVDLGCGRGEFLELLKEAGIPAQGVDGESGMVARCRELGLEVEQADLLEFLSAQKDASLAGVFSAQVVEHLPPDAISTLLHLSFQKLRPGGVFLAETINPRSLLALSHNFTLDLSHRQPVHPDTLAFIAESIGFQPVEVRYCSPVPEMARLQAVPPTGELEQAFNDNVRHLNELLYGYQDYALIARKP